MNRSTRILIAAAAILASPSISIAQTYPSQAIKIIVATPPGGIADIVGRTFANTLNADGKTAVVENRTGGAGAIAAVAGARAPADGYTLFVGMHQTNAILPHLTKVQYDGIKDFAAITNVAGSPNILVVNPKLPVKTVKELADYIKANPGKSNYASQGNGSSGHILGEQFKRLVGAEIAHVPYRGAAPAAQDIVAGHVTMLFDVVSLAQTQIKSGKMRALAVASPKRMPNLPDVPTMIEAGFPDVHGGAWFGLMAPAGTPRPIIDWLNKEAHKSFSAKDVQDRFAAQGMISLLGTPEQFDAHIKAEYGRWGKIISQAGIKM